LVDDHQKDHLGHKAIALVIDVKRCVREQQSESGVGIIIASSEAKPSVGSSGRDMVRRSGAKKLKAF